MGPSHHSETSSENTGIQCYVTHTLEYSYTFNTAGHFTSVGLLDGEEFMYYDSDKKELLPKTDWIKEVESASSYWQKETRDVEVQQDWLIDKLQALESTNQAGNTLQRVYGCEIDDNGVTRGYDKSKYNGKDFISLNLDNKTWTAVDDRAWSFTENWNPAQKTAASWRNFLMETCVDRLKRYMRYSTMAGSHALRRRYRCELDGDGTRRGSIHFYIDGERFFSLDLKTGTWNAANTKAENFITEWDHGGHQAEHWKNYLNNNCIERLMQYVQSRTNTEERKGTHALQYITDITAGISYTVGELDGEQFVCYGSNVTEMILKTEWIKKIDADDPNYRKREKDRMSDEHGDLQDLLIQAVERLSTGVGGRVSPTDEPQITCQRGVAVAVAFGLLLITSVCILCRMKNSE